MKDFKTPNCIGATVRLIVSLCVAFLFLCVGFVDNAKSTNTYSPADLHGNWEGHSQASGVPWWERTSLNIDDKGNFKGSTVGSDNSSVTVSGNFAIDENGTITSSAEPMLKCHMDAGKTLFACTDIWSSGPLVGMKVFTKKAAFYSIADLAGTWIANDLATPPDRHWGHYHFTIASDGSFSAILLHDDGHSDELSGTLSMTSDGNISVYIPGSQNSVAQCTLDSGKTVYVCTPPNQTGEHGNIGIFSKQAASYSLTDLEGEWFVNSLISSPAWWGSGFMTVQKNGSFSTWLETSSGDEETIAGSFHITQQGEITATSSFIPPSYCTMDADKTIFSCIGFNHHGGNQSELTVFTKKLKLTQSRVTEIYVATFGRAPDTAGLAYWVGQVERGYLTLDQVAQSFFDQPETKAKYPDGTSYASFLTIIYQNVLNRAPDQAGLKYWVGELDRKAFSRSQAIMAIINGAKAASGSPIDAAILANKTEVGLYFVASTLGRMSDSALLLMHAKNVMNNIDSSSQTLITAKANIDTLASQTVSPPIVTLTADEDSVLVNQTAFLTWTVSGATSCTASGNWSGDKDPTGGSYVINVGSVAGLRTYNLSCTGNGGSVSESVNVTVINDGGGTGGACEQVSWGNSLVKVTNSSNTMVEIYFGTSVAFGGDIEPNYCNLVGIELPPTMNSFQIVAEVTQCTTDPEGGCDTIFGPTKYVPITLQKGVTKEIVIGSGFFN
jgi:hypothetical protein